MTLRESMVGTCAERKLQVRGDISFCDVLHAVPEKDAVSGGVVPAFFRRDEHL